jgi:hypothetical protein
MHCPVNSSYPFVDPGYWRIDAVTILECSPPAACQYTGNNNFTECSAGYTGQNCGNCNPEFYRLGLDCKACPSKWVRALTIIAFVAVFGMIIVRLLLSDGKMSADVRIAIQAMQLISLYNTISPNWPPYVKSLIDALSFSVSPRLEFKSWFDSFLEHQF